MGQRLYKHRFVTIGQKSPSRKRFTRQIARIQPDEKLLDIFTSSQGFVRADEREPGSISPGLLARQSNINALCYNELLARGYEREALDYDPEKHLEEVKTDDETKSLLESAAAI